MATSFGSVENDSSRIVTWELQLQFVAVNLKYLQFRHMT